MKYYDNGCFHSVLCTSEDVSNFASQWPCSGFNFSDTVTFEFDKKNGDLVDLVYRKNGKVRSDDSIDGSAMVALSQDAQKFAEKKEKEYVDTVWEVWTYDVWGNEKDGFEVNDKSCQDRNYQLKLKVEVNNSKTKYEFLSAYPTDKQIRQIFNLKRVKLDIEGDDLNIYVNHASTGYPLGEMNCISHKSLSAIRKE